MNRCLLIWLFLYLPVFSATPRPVPGQDGVEVSGSITGYDGQPVSGVTISVEGLPQPVISGEDGTFTFVAPSGFVWILITPVEHYKRQRIFLNNRTFLHIHLTPMDVRSGYDQTIDLYRSTNRRDFVSSYFVPDPESFDYFPYQSLDQYFQGTVPGMLSVSFSGMPGNGAASFLRGFRSLHTNNQPLYVIDGIPIESPGIYNSQLDGYSYNPLTSLAPFDITNITILKDYTSISTYGSRASNGVVLIETLTPTEVQTTIDFSMRTGISFTPQHIPQMNSDQYRTYANEILNTSGQLEETFRERYPGLFADETTPGHYRYMHNTLWQDEIFSNSLMNDLYLRVMGGDEIARYGLSVGFMNHQGVIRETDFERVNIRFVGAFNILPWLRMNLSTNLGINNSDLKESARIRQTSPILTSLFKAPLLMPYAFDVDGNQLVRLDNIEALGVSNPAAVINNFTANSTNNRFLTSVNLEGDITSHLKLNSIIGVNFNSFTESIFMPNHGMETYYRDEAFNAMKSLKNQLFALYNDNFMTYSPDLGNQHQLFTSAGIRINSNTYEEDWGIAKNSHENDEYRSLQDGTAYLREMGGENARWNRLTTYLNTKYIYRDNYLFYGTLSADASSRTGSEAEDLLRVFNVPFGLFYSAGFAWRLSGESFLENAQIIDNLAWRISYGVAGNDDIGNLSVMDYYRLTRYRETSGMIPSVVSNKSLKYETTSQWNTGIDLSLLAGRLQATVDLFEMTTRDMLVYESLPSYIGTHFLPVNAGTVRNRGMEFFLSSYLRYSGRFKWNAGVNMAVVNNSLLEIAGGQVITPFEGGEFISREGEPLLAFYGYQFKGTFTGAAEAATHGLRNERGVPYGAGDAIFEDISGPEGTPDGIINEFDKVLLGSPIPRYYGGFQNNLSLGRWSLNALFQFVAGNKVFNYVRYQNEKMTDLSNQSAHVLNRWQYDGHETMVPRAAWADPVGNADFSTRWIEDGSYLRLKNLTLSYNVPERIWMFRNAGIFITATNLVTWSNYLGYDPEYSYSYNTTEMGLDYGLTPVSRNIMLGVKIGL